jgi:hypothetical protein
MIIIIMMNISKQGSDYYTHKLSCVTPPRSM